MSVRGATNMITIAPLGDDEVDDLSLNATDTNGSLMVATTTPSVVIKQEPIDSLMTHTATPTTTSSTGIRLSNISLPLLTRGLGAGGGTFTLAPVSSGSSMGLQGLQSVVPVSGGLLRFSSAGGIQARTPLGKNAAGQPVFLIPTNSNPRQKITPMRQQTPIKLIPIQPKKTQAVVAPQTKQISTATTRSSKGIISFSQDNPDELVIGRSEPVVSPKFGISGMIFNSRTVTGGGRVKYTKDYLCNLCKHMSDSIENFKSHFNSAHMFCCDYCTFKAFSRYDVVMHTRSTHTEAIEDLKGYEMFEEGEVVATSIPVSTPISLPTQATSTSGNGLVTVPVMGMNGNKLVLQSVSNVSSALSAAITNPKDATKGSTNGYFTYKIVQGNSNDPKKYECDLCQYQTFNLKTMYDHASSHTMNDLNKSAHSSTTWECFYCNFRSFEQAKVVKHVSTVHPKQHIQLKRYTSTSVIKPQLSAASGAPTTTTKSVSTANNITNTSPTITAPSLVIVPDSDEGDAVVETVQKPTEATDMSQNEEEKLDKDPPPPVEPEQKTDSTEKSESTEKTDTEEKSKDKAKKSGKEVDDEDDETAMWGCYYCEFEDQDRHNIVAHVKADHSGRKIVITRRRLQKDKDKEKEEKEKANIGKEPENEGESEQKNDANEPSAELTTDESASQPGNNRKDYSSLIIKLKTKTKKDNKTLSLLRKELQEKKIKGMGEKGEDGTILPDLAALQNKLDADEDTLLSPSGDLEMPVLEPMVSGRRSPRSPRGDKSPKASTRLRFPIGMKKEVKVKKRGPVKKQGLKTSPNVTRIKSDLAFDQAEVIVLDHVPDDLNVDVSQLYVFNRSKQEAKCNICHREYVGKMAYGHMREHLMIHTGERIWGCPYCNFRCNRRFTLYMHVKKLHPTQPIKLVRRRPYQIGTSGGRESKMVKYKLQGTLNECSSSNKLRGPRSCREQEYLQIAEHTWQCPYCSREDVFKGSIKIHMKAIHPDQDCEAEPKKCDRQLDTLHEQIIEKKLPMKDAKVYIYRMEDMEKFKILNEILEENGRNLTMDLDIDDIPDDYTVFPSNVTEQLTSSVNTTEPLTVTAKPRNLSHAKYQCPYCSTRGVRPSTVKLHILSMHPDKELYIHDLRVSRRSQNQHHLFVCCETDCKFMTNMQQALYAHVAKNPTHVNPGLHDADAEAGTTKIEMNISPRVASLRRKPEKVEAKPEIDLEHEKSQTEQLAPLKKTAEETKEQEVKNEANTDMAEDVSCQSSLTFEEPDADDTAHWPEAKKAVSTPKVAGFKKKRTKTPLPANHRDGVPLFNVFMNCKYCDFAETCDVMIIKEHLQSEHPSQIPLAINQREREKRKLARLHICPMTTCEYATYFEKAYCIHLEEVHSDVFFPFQHHLKQMNTGNDKQETPSNVTEEETEKAQETEAPFEGSELPDFADDYFSNDDTPILPQTKPGKRRRKNSSDDEPEWRPNSRRPRKKAVRAKRRSVPSRSPYVVPDISDSSPPMSTNPRSLLYNKAMPKLKSILRTELIKEAAEAKNERKTETEQINESAVPEKDEPSPMLETDKLTVKPAAKKLEMLTDTKRQFIAANLPTSLLNSAHEAITEYPSAVEHVDIRFLCFKCNKKYQTLDKMKDHLIDSHGGKVNFCMDMYAKYMRKKQSVFICVQPTCDFCCKTWGTMRLHWTNEHPETITEEALQYFDKSIENSPAFRKRRSAKQGEIRKNVVVPLRMTDEAGEDDTVSREESMDEGAPIEGVDEAFSHPSSTSPNRAAEKSNQYAFSSEVDEPLILKHKRRKHLTSVDEEEPQVVPPKRTRTLRGKKAEDLNSMLQSWDSSHDTDSENTAKGMRKKRKTVDSDHGTPTTEKTGDVDYGSETEEDLPKRSRKSQPRKIIRKAQSVKATKQKEEVKEEKVISADENIREEPSEKEDSDHHSDGENCQNSAPEKGGNDSEAHLDTIDSQDSLPLERPDQSDEVEQLKNKNNPVSPHGSSMDVMYQCSHCTYLSTDKANIQSHLSAIHSIQEAEYTEIGAEFDRDGRVNMSVGEHNGQRENKEQESESASPKTEKTKSSVLKSDDVVLASSSAAAVEQPPSVSKIKPLKLSVRSGEVTKVISDDEANTDDENTGATGEKKDDESEEESESSSEDDDDDDDDKSDDSSSEEDDSDDDGSSDSGSSEDDDEDDSDSSEEEVASNKDSSKTE